MNEQDWSGKTETRFQHTGLRHQTAASNTRNEGVRTDHTYIKQIGKLNYKHVNYNHVNYNSTSVTQSAEPAHKKLGIVGMEDPFAG